MRVTAAAFLAVSVPLAAAQTFTDCDPTQKSCPADLGLNAATFNTDFTQGSSANASWSAAAYTTINYGSQGAEFTIANAEQAPTIQSDFYIFFGRVEVKMKAAPGTGIVSSIVLESDDLDEIDWEFLGGNTAQVETNFFGKGNTTDYTRAVYYPVAQPQTQFHTYTIDWTVERLQFLIDGTIVRTLSYSDALANGGQNYPQTPMRVKLGNWAAGGPTQPKGTVDWAGGSTDFSQAPFTMYVESVAITNYNPGSSYEFGDQTGSYGSIKVVNGTTTGTVSAGTASQSITATGSNATSAPTSSHSVVPVANSNAVVSSTVTGSAYSTNTASVSAQNTNNSTAGPASTEVASQPTASVASGTTFASRTATGSASSASTGTVQQTSAADANHVVAAGSLLSVALAFWML